MNEKKIRDSFLYIEMVLATPGAKLHQGIRRLRKNRELATAILLGVILLLAGIVLWQFRRNDTWLLLLAGIGLITVFSLLFSWIWRHGDAILGIGEMLTYPFYSSYEQCRKALDPTQADTFNAKAAENPADPNPFVSGNNAADQKHSGQYNTTDSQTQSGDANATDRQQSQNTRARKEYHREHEHNTSEKRYRRTSPGNAQLEEAKAFFGVDIPFTADEIKQRRNQLLKKYHPDNPDGSEEMCKKINECYALLIRYAA